MARWPLLGGAYEAQSIIANAQRCINLYPEINQKDAPVPVTHYPTPGKRQLASGFGLGRGLFTASDGTAYGVSGESLFWFGLDGAPQVLGTISNLPTPVRWVDNSIELLVLDGTEDGAWVINIATKAFSRKENFGATLGAYLDTFTIVNVIGTKNFSVSEPNSYIFPGDIGSKTATPDPLAGVVTVHRELWNIGTKSTEIWTTVADVDFPFQIIPGAFVEYGCGAPYSIATADISVFWLAQNEEGQGMVLRGKGYEALRISTHAIENMLQSYSTLSDVQAYTYQENGHIFYVMNFPSADQTWAYDESTGAWHQRAWMDQDGYLHRDRLCSIITANGKRFGQDWETGAIYEVSVSIATDSGSPILRLRSFPHLPTMQGSDGAHIALEGKRIKYHKFMADMVVGTEEETSVTFPPAPDSESLLLHSPDNLLLTDPDGFGILLDTAVPGGVPGPKVMLRWSNTRGASWEGTLVRSLGSAGQYNTQPSWQRTGMARDRIWELSWVTRGKTALNGAWVNLSIMKS